MISRFFIQFEKYLLIFQIFVLMSSAAPNAGDGGLR